ncbi:efflux RND transporter periplasmic adaptor subunit [Saccharobesus litoralis]|nr:efflux RND transporter periplasmic adaptor subunit [Saccharobesus litoralis]
MSCFSRFFFTPVVVSLLAFSNLSQANPEQPPALVHVDEIKANDIPARVWRSATVVSRNDAMVASRVAGQVVWLKEAGDKVELGDKLIKLDDSGLKLDLATQQANIRGLQAQKTFLQKEVERLTRLASQNNASKTLLEQRTSELDTTLAKIDAVNADIAKVQLQLAYSQLQAPFSGVVTNRLSQVGEVVSQGDPLLRLVDTNNIDIKVMVPIAAWQFVQPNMQIEVDSDLGQAQLKVRKVVPVADSQSRLMEVLLDASQTNWPVGGNAKVAVPLPKLDKDAAFLVPRDALVLRRGQNSVFVVKDNLAQQVPVVESNGYGQWIAVKGDLTVGQAVIIRGAERLRHGMPVSVKQDNSKLVNVREL